MNIIDFIKKVTKKDKQEQQEQESNVALEPISLETEFKIFQLKHMINTVRLYLINQKMDSADSNSIDFMINVIKIHQEVAEEIEYLFETGEFLKVYEIAYNSLN